MARPPSNSVGVAVAVAVRVPAPAPAPVPVVAVPVALPVLPVVERITRHRQRRPSGLSAPSWCRKDQVIADKDGQIQRLREDLAIDQMHGVGASAALRGDTGGRDDTRRASIVNNQRLMVEFRDV